MQGQNLWAPWRIEYLEALDGSSQPKPNVDAAKKQSAADHASPTGCFMCDAFQAPEADFAKLLILVRDERGILMLNRYPYTNGHLLVIPEAHVTDITDLTDAQRHGLMDLANLGTQLLKRTMHCQGINLGMNLGRAAGAAVPGHCHMHLVPRWAGDVNFIQVVGSVRVIPQSLDRAYELLRHALKDTKK